MLDVSRLYLIALVSQATFALSLAIVAWSDRRTRGTVWLAIACAMQFGWTASRFVAIRHVTLLSEALSACLLVVLMYVVFIGVRWFACQRGVESRSEVAWVGAGLLAVLIGAVTLPSLSVQLGRCIALIIGCQAVMLLWRTPFKGLIMPARITSVLLAGVLAVIAFHLAAILPMESNIAPGQETVSILALRGFTILLVSLLSFSFIGLFVGEANLRLHQDSRTDSLTQLRNRRAIEEIAVREVHVAQRTGRPLALLMMDLDHFKKLNDTWGHAFGDRALCAVGAALQSETGLRDVPARMGGEEFALLLPGRTLAEATLLAERIRAAIARLTWSGSGQNFPLTISIGVSMLRPGEPHWIEMLCRADAALYRAKRAGRNRVDQCDAAPRPEETEAQLSSAAPPRSIRRWRSRMLAPRQVS